MSLPLHSLDYEETGTQSRTERCGALSVARIARISTSNAAPDAPYGILTGRLAERHPNDVVERLFVNDSFADEVDAYVEAQRKREREEAAQEAAT